MVLNVDAKFEGELACAFKNDINDIFVHRLKNRNLILESKTVELNINKNSKQPHWLDTVWKLYFILEINE